MGKRGTHFFISAFLILCLLMGMTTFAHPGETDAEPGEIQTIQTNEKETDLPIAEEDTVMQAPDEPEQSKQADDSEDESAGLPELTIEEVTAGSEYDAKLNGVIESDYDYVVMKVWNDHDGEDSAVLYPAEWQEDEEEFSGFLAHLVIDDEKTYGIYQVIAYGLHVSEMTEIETEDDITLDMLDDEEVAVKIAQGVFEIPEPETESEKELSEKTEAEEEQAADFVEEDAEAEAVVIKTPKLALKAGSVVKPANAVQGIDISHHQGTINWKKVKEDGVKFAIIRCGYGDNVPGTKAEGGNDDNKWAYNIAQCEKLGIPYGVYIYSHANTEKKAKSEADHCLRLLMGHKPSFPVFLDLEDSDLDGLSNGTLANLTKVWADKIKAAGYVPGVYSSKYWWTNKLTNSKFNSYCKWVAQWNTSCTYTGKYAAWQYSDKGSVDGITGNVDMDFWLPGWQKLIGSWYYYNGNGMATGWRKLKGVWYYFKRTGAMVTGWQKIGGLWYYFDNDGAMITGWKKSGGIWYHFNADGAMETGWQKIGGIWYYFDADGGMQTGWLKLGSNWYYLNADGEMVTEWLELGQNKYYFLSSGPMSVGWEKIDGKWYYFDDLGIMQTGWLKLGSYYYYLNADGIMKTSWLKLGSSQYYLKSTGIMATGWLDIEGTTYYFRSNGAMAVGWLKIGQETYLFDNTGSRLTGWQQIEGKWYYFTGTGAMKTGWFKQGGNWYYLNADGIMATGWLKVGSKWYYMNEKGAMVIGWLKIKGKWYYFQSDGTMVTGKVKIGKKWYTFDSNGVWAA